MREVKGHKFIVLQLSTVFSTEPRLNGVRTRCNLIDVFGHIAAADLHK